MTRILFVEDDFNLGQLLTESLTRSGFQVTWCESGIEGLRTFKTEPFHLCLLDVMLPSKDGFTLAAEIKELNPKMPLIFLTARSMDIDKIKGFETGCDDYITKPFNVTELQMRIRAVLKRIEGYSDPQSVSSKIGAYTFNHNNMTLMRHGEELRLSSKEAGLLDILIRNKGQFVARETILEKVWGNTSHFSANSMDVYLSKLRKMLKSDPSIEILNAYGVGFKLIVNVEP